MLFKNIAKAVSLVLSTSIVLGLFSISKDVAAAGITLSGSCYAQKYGDISGTWDDSSATLTLTGRPSSGDAYRQIEGITVGLNNSTGVSGSLKYSVYVQQKGWQDYKNAGTEAGTKFQGLKIEGLKMELTGELANQYTVEYEVKLQKLGNAQGFVSDGTIAGIPDDSKLIEEIKIRVVPARQGSSTSVNYRIHLDSHGWQNKWIADGTLAGKSGQSNKIDGIEMHLSGNQYKGGITYRSNIQDKGWEKNWSSNGSVSGTSGYRSESIAIKLTGEVADHYDVYYRVYAQDYGWLDWAKNGATSGTTGLSRRIEALQIKLVAKGGSAPGDLGGIKSSVDIAEVKPDTPILPGRGIFKMPSGAKVSYSVKTADGWSVIKSDGQVLKVSGPVTGIAVGVNVPKSELSLYADVPNFGSAKKDSKDPYDAPFDLRIVDTGKKVEHIRMALYEGYYYCNDKENTEEFYSYRDPDDQNYDVFYRVKTSKKGWMAWTKEGMRCGTDEIGNTISAIQIVVLPQGQTPAADLNGVTSDNEKSILRMQDFPKPKLVTSGNKFASWCLKQFPNNQKTLNYLSQHKRPPTYIFYSVASTWPYKLGGKSKKKCDCTGFAVWVFKNYHKKKVKFNSHSMAYKTGKTVSYKSIKPGDLLCVCNTYHGDVFFYVGKDEYGHDVILDGMTPKINGKIKHVYPCLRYIDLEAWATQSKHYVRRK